jgi:hypothetical protein
MNKVKRKGYKQVQKDNGCMCRSLRWKDDYGRGVMDRPHFTHWHALAVRRAS